MSVERVWWNPSPDEDLTGWWLVEVLDHIEPPQIDASQINIDLDSRHDSGGARAEHE